MNPYLIQTVVLEQVVRFLSAGSLIQLQKIEGLEVMIIAWIIVCLEGTVYSFLKEKYDVFVFVSPVFD